MAAAWPALARAQKPAGGRGRCWAMRQRSSEGAALRSPLSAVPAGNAHMLRHGCGYALVPNRLICALVPPVNMTDYDRHFRCPQCPRY